MSPTHTRKQGRLYRYYVSQAAIKGTDSDQLRVPAGEIERIVIDQVRRLLAAPEVIVATWKEARHTIKSIQERDVRDALLAFQPLWDELFPIEQARVVAMLVERVQLRHEHVDVVLRAEGFGSLVAELNHSASAERRAA